MVIMWWNRDNNWQKGQTSVLVDPQSHHSKKNITASILITRPRQPPNERKQLVFGSALRNHAFECVFLKCQKPWLTSQFNIAWCLSGIHQPGRLPCLLAYVFSVHTRRWRRWKAHSKTARPAFSTLFPSGRMVRETIRYNKFETKHNYFGTKSEFFLWGSPKCLEKRDLWQRHGISIIWA